MFGGGGVGAAGGRPARSMPACMPAVDVRKAVTVVRARVLRAMTFWAHWPRSAADMQSPDCRASMRAQKSAIRCSTVVVGATVADSAVRQFFVGGFVRKRYPVSVL